MTELSELNLSSDILKPILDSGFDGLPQAVSLLLNHAMLLERSQHLEADPYQRNPQRNGHANGFKERTLDSRIGQLSLRIPQTRGGESSFYPSSLERGQRSEKALSLALAQMYLQGVSTRRVTKILERLCGLEITSTQVSRVAAELDAMLEAWRQRPLAPVAHLILDARYEKVRCDGVVRSVAVFTALGIRSEDGKRTVLGTSVGFSEAEVHWREFLTSLKERGVFPSGLITSDAHEGLRAALTKVFPGVPWQRCQFHLQQNAQAYVPKQEMKTEVAADIRGVFGSESLVEAREKLSKIVKKYEEKASKLSKWMEENIPEGFTIYAFAPEIRKRLRTSNLCEMINKQLKRRTRVVGLFPNEASCLRLVSALLMEVSDEWETSRPYLNPQHLK